MSFWQPPEAPRTLKGTVREWLLTLDSLPPGPPRLMVHLFITRFGPQGHRLFAKRKPCSEGVQCGPQSANKTKQSSISKLGWGPRAPPIQPLDSLSLGTLRCLLDIPKALQNALRTRDWARPGMAGPHCIRLTQIPHTGLTKASSARRPKNWDFYKSSG